MSFVKNSCRAVAAGAAGLALSVNLAVGNPFDNDKADIERALAKPGMIETVEATYGDINTSLDCYGLALYAFKAWLAKKVPDAWGKSYGPMMVLSAHATDAFQKSMMVDDATLKKLDDAAVLRFQANPNPIIEKCNALTLKAYGALLASPNAPVAPPQVAKQPNQITQPKGLTGPQIDLLAFAQITDWCAKFSTAYTPEVLSEFQQEAYRVLWEAVPGRLTSVSSDDRNTAMQSAMKQYHASGDETATCKRLLAEGQIKFGLFAEQGE